MLSRGEQLSPGIQRKSGERRALLHWQCQKAGRGFHWLVGLAFEDCLYLKLLKALLTGTSLSVFPKTFLHKPSFPLVVEAIPVHIHFLAVAMAALVVGCHPSHPAQPGALWPFPVRYDGFCTLHSAWFHHCLLSCLMVGSCLLKQGRLIVIYVV